MPLVFFDSHLPCGSYSAAVWSQISGAGMRAQSKVPFVNPSFSSCTPLVGFRIVISMASR